MNPADIFIGLAKKFNHYQPGPPILGHSCQNCIRKQFSFPDTCNDGWPMGDPKWKDGGESCINFKAKEIDAAISKAESL